MLSFGSSFYRYDQDQVVFKKKNAPISTFFFNLMIKLLIGVFKKAQRLIDSQVASGSV